MTAWFTAAPKADGKSSGSRLNSRQNYPRPGSRDVTYSHLAMKYLTRSIVCHIASKKTEQVTKDADLMKRWLVKVKSKRGLALRDVLICAEDESAARRRVQRMYLLSDVATICPSLEAMRFPQAPAQKR